VCHRENKKQTKNKTKNQRSNNKTPVTGAKKEVTETNCMKKKA